MQNAGGCDFATELASDGRGPFPIWTPAALPSILALVPLPEDLAGPTPALEITGIGEVLADLPPDLVLDQGGEILRLHADAAVSLTEPCAALIPLDRLVEVRTGALLRLFHAVTERPLGPNPAALSPWRRSRLVLSLRALDAHLDKASHRQIAEGLFGRDRIPERAWKTHDLRDRTIRLVRDGVGLMSGGYRQLLLYPYRRKL